MSGGARSGARPCGPQVGTSCGGAEAAADIGTAQ